MSKKELYHCVHCKLAFVYFFCLSKTSYNNWSDFQFFMKILSERYIIGVLLKFWKSYRSRNFVEKFSALQTLYTLLLAQFSLHAVLCTCKKINVCDM